MKSKNASNLVQVTSELTSLYELISLMEESDEIQNNVELQVKGKGDGLILLPTLKRCHKLIDEIDSDGDIFVPIHDDFDDCIEYLDKNYSIKSKWIKLPETLREKDFKKISGDLDRMIRTLIGYSRDLSLVSLKTKNKKSTKIVKGLDKKPKKITMKL